MAASDFADFARRLVAARGTGTVPPEVLRDMAHRAEEVALHFTHPGRARDDALALFWQVAPAALADTSALAGTPLDPARAAARMTAAVRASRHARDFAETVLAEPLLRAVSEQALVVLAAHEAATS